MFPFTLHVGKHKFYLSVPIYFQISAHIWRGPAGLLPYLSQFRGVKNKYEVGMRRCEGRRARGGDCGGRGREGRSRATCSSRSRVVRQFGGVSPPSATSVIRRRSEGTRIALPILVVLINPCSRGIYRDLRGLCD